MALPSCASETSSAVDPAVVADAVGNVAVGQQAADVAVEEGTKVPAWPGSGSARSATGCGETSSWRDGAPKRHLGTEKSSCIDTSRGASRQAGSARPPRRRPCFRGADGFSSGDDVAVRRFWAGPAGDGHRPARRSARGPGRPARLVQAGALPEHDHPRRVRAAGRRRLLARRRISGRWPRCTATTSTSSSAPDKRRIVFTPPLRAERRRLRAAAVSLCHALGLDRSRAPAQGPEDRASTPATSAATGRSWRRATSSSATIRPSRRPS